VQIDKARGNDEPCCIDLHFAAQRVGGNRSDLSTDDPDIPHGVKAGQGIHHSATLDNDVVRLSGEE
jgi:hypothetical protein